MSTHPIDTSIDAPIDARGPQFNAALTSLVLTAALALAETGHVTSAVVLLGILAALFATAVVLGVQRTPAAYVFRTFVRPRLGPATRVEDPRPPRFAQGIGLVFVGLALAGFTVGPTWLGYVAGGFALVAALLNATVQVCLGCQIYGVCQLPQQDYVAKSTDLSSEDTTEDSTDDSTGRPVSSLPISNHSITYKEEVNA